MVDNHTGILVVVARIFLAYFFPGDQNALKSELTVSGGALSSPQHHSFLFICFFVFGGVAHLAYGSSQTRSQIGAAAAGLHHSYSHTRSEPHLRPTPQLVATLDP